MRRTLSALSLVAVLGGCGAATEDTDGATANSGAMTASTPAAVEPPSGTVGLGQERLTATVSNLRGEVSGLNSRITDTGTVVELPSDALFEFDSAELGPEAENLLRKALPAVRQAPSGPLGFVGHTDSKGEDAYNQALSERRAQAVADWFAQQPGIRQRERNVSGQGEAEPVAPNARPDGSDDPAGRARNRRVELVLPNTQ